MISFFPFQYATWSLPSLISSQYILPYQPKMIQNSLLNFYFDFFFPNLWFTAADTLPTFKSAFLFFFSSLGLRTTICLDQWIQDSNYTTLALNAILQMFPKFSTIQVHNIMQSSHFRSWLHKLTHLPLSPVLVFPFKTVGSSPLNEGFLSCANSQMGNDLGRWMWGKKSFRYIRPNC